MGRAAYIRIQNRSTYALNVTVKDRVRVEERGISEIQGNVPVGGQLPVMEQGQAVFSGRYTALEGGPDRRIQKDGHFELVVQIVGDNAGAAASTSSSITLYCDHNSWWAKPGPKAADAAEAELEKMILSYDVDDEEEQGVHRIDLRIYNHIPTANWMEQCAADLRNMPLCQVALPGTHDSGTYAFDANLGAAPDSELTMTIQDKITMGKGLIRKLTDALSDSILGLVYERMCKCQDKSIAEQLNAGIRYLDLRIAPHSKDDQHHFYTCHGVYCVNMETVLDEIVTFLNSHPKEIVLLDLNHFYAMSVEQHKAFTDQLVAKLGDKMANPHKLNPKSTIADFWNQKAQAVIIYHDDDTQATKPNQLWNRMCIESPWPNSNDRRKLQSKLDEKIKARPTECFFVLQGILTPDGELIQKEIMENKGHTSIKSIASRIGNRVVDWVEDSWKQEKHNIIIVDFFQDCSMVPAILNMNLHPKR